MSVAALEVGPCVVCRKPARRAGGSHAQFRCAGACSRAATEIDSETRFADDPGAQLFVRTFPGGAELEQIGDYLGVTRERVRQIEARAREKLLKRLAVMKIAPEDLTLFVSQRDRSHPLEYTQQNRNPNATTEDDAARHQRRSTCACGARKKFRERACRACMGTANRKNPGTDAGNLSRAIDRLPPSDASIAAAEVIDGWCERTEAAVARFNRVGEVIDALREWMATAPQVDIEFPEDGQ